MPNDLYIFSEFLGIPSIDWFKGQITVKIPWISWENRWFPKIFPSTNPLIPGYSWDVFCCRQAMQKLDTAEAELSRLRGDLQARDGGTWLAREEMLTWSFNGDLMVI